MTTPVDASLSHLLGRLEVVEESVRAAVVARRGDDHDTDIRFRGLYISEGEVDRLLAPGGPTWAHGDAGRRLTEVEVAADRAEATGSDLRLRRLAWSFGCDRDDLALLMVALAPELDPRFERLFAYLHDDVSRRRPSAGLALALSGLGLLEGRARLGPSGALVASRLVVVEQGDDPFLTRPLRVPDRVTNHLLGDNTVASEITELVVPEPEAVMGDDQWLEGPLRRGCSLFYVRTRGAAPGRSLAASALARAGLEPLVIDLARVRETDDLVELGALAVREAKLRGAGLVVAPIDAIAGRGSSGVRAFVDAKCPTVLIGRQPWNAEWSPDPPVLLEAPAPTLDQRRAAWAAGINGQTALDFDPALVTAQFRLAPERTVRAARAAARQATAAGRPISPEDLFVGARAENGASLERLARRIEPKVGWQDLVLAPGVLGQLQELAARVRLRDLVLDDWGLGVRFRGRGSAVLLAGPSGTGKTISAEVIAHDLGLDLYVIDLSQVVDKYVGETEKNLDRIFDEADGLNGVLLFDEADALFGKRSDVKDARDRWANVEVAYLLQRMELFDGVAMLATNLRTNIDEAFTRRLDAVVEFTLPDVQSRKRLWLLNLETGPPLADDIDVDFLAGSFKLSGGSIRNIVASSAFLAAGAGRAIHMADIVRAVQREYHKLGRLCVEAEFGPYLAIAKDSP